ncbi:hypothetical protein BJY01DRAFT_255015 [Aspergillus pseudoustus]|uniref:Myb-like domain-containing protein n=1 Tax=Aspergillus pseudoustus TaxID=1810923 RepID=A0ABR4INM2_9EURO
MATPTAPLVPWTDEERNKLITLRRRYTDLTWEDFHKLNFFPGRTRTALYGQWVKLVPRQTRSEPAGAGNHKETSSKASETSKDSNTERTKDQDTLGQEIQGSDQKRSEVTADGVIGPQSDAMVIHENNGAEMGESSITRSSELGASSTTNENSRATLELPVSLQKTPATPDTGSMEQTTSFTQRKLDGALRGLTEDIKETTENRTGKSSVDNARGQSLPIAKPLSIGTQSSSNGAARKVLTISTQTQEFVQRMGRLRTPISLPSAKQSPLQPRPATIEAGTRPGKAGYDVPLDRSAVQKRRRLSEPSPTNSSKILDLFPTLREQPEPPLVGLSSLTAMVQDVGGTRLSSANTDSLHTEGRRSTAVSLFSAPEPVREPLWTGRRIASHGPDLHPKPLGVIAKNPSRRVQPPKVSHNRHLLLDSVPTNRTIRDILEQVCVRETTKYSELRKRVEEINREMKTLAAAVKPMIEQASMANNRLERARMLLQEPEQILTLDSSELSSFIDTLSCSSVQDTCLMRQHRADDASLLNGDSGPTE